MHVESDSQLEGPLLSPLDGFYGELRARVDDYLNKNGGRGPTDMCIYLYKITLAVWVALHALVLYTGCQTWGYFGYFITFLHIVASGILGGYGHNWVHQPKYRTWATLSLDLVGFSSDNWYREHLLQHHLYTNTALDNHFRGTEPFLAAAPDESRTVLNEVSAIAFPAILAFGVIANWINVFVGTIKGTEDWRWSMCTQPFLAIAYASRFGFTHAAMHAFWVVAGMSIWYFTIALMNHNTDHTLKSRSVPRDWAEQQLMTCSDLGVGLGFLQSWCYLWLNYHTVHHLFPTTDMSRHPGIQGILLEVAAKHGVEYNCPNFMEAFIQLVLNLYRPLRLERS